MLSYGAECVGNHLGLTPYDVAFCSDMIRPIGHPQPSPQDEDIDSTTHSVATLVRNISVGEMSQSFINLSISVVDGLVDSENIQNPVCSLFVASFGIVAKTGLEIRHFQIKTSKIHKPTKS